MCMHIISVIKGTELRRDLFKSGGIGKKWSTEKFIAFADFEVRAPSSNEILAQQMQTLFPAKILLPMFSWKRGRRLWHLPAAWSQQEDLSENERFPCRQTGQEMFGGCN
jgi:hypothetical protein